MSRLSRIALGCLLIGLGLMTALPQVMSTLAPYDDEGYVMMTLRAFSEGHPLYGDTHTQYGPAFYFLADPIHSILGLPLTHDAVRFKTIAFWLVTAGLACGCWIRLQVQPTIAIGLTCLAFLHLDKLSLEPGHPQEWALVLTMLAIYILLGRSPIRFAMAAFLATLIGFIKLNCGLVVAVPLLIAASIGENPPRVSLSPTAFWWLQRIALVLLIAPILLIAAVSFRLAPLASIPFLISVLGLAISWSYFRHSLIVQDSNVLKSIRPLIEVVGIAIATTLGLVAITLASGTTLTELGWGLIGQHQRFTATFFHAIPYQIESIAYASVALLLFLSVALKWTGRFNWGGFSDPTNNQEAAHHSAMRHCFGLAGRSTRCSPIWKRHQGRIAAAFAIATSIVVAIAIFRDLGQPLEHGLQPRGAASFLAIVGPLLAPWLMLVRRISMANRAMLATLTCYGSLIAFPTPGTQLAIGTLPALLILGVLLQDGLERLNAYLPQFQASLIGRPSTFAIILISTVGLHGLSTFYRWRINSPLNLAGAHWIRIPLERAEREIALTRAMTMTGCDSLVFDGHSHNRFFFWTKMKPLTAANPTFWPRMLSSSEQSAWSIRLDQSQDRCVVIPTESNRLAGDQAIELRTQIRDKFEMLDNVDDWEIGIRKGTE